ncbi:uncharacterized protein DDB_G0284459-like [Chelonus insularis]|uniref:uncharacterized protein DDB_G0284459-like n=1 Tax=Chelonus insularis TaxID=460826 RepID=UPI00158B3416|nr:uncharacterized protein DDB_G0284459-like [Chelonus insularis]XP_034947372.1 uncharacterized protein DDB_G0284459-like [Chelonus insularis]XP_034947373.1 uncharacterized protein DDB_G0284459-like [Chelonus insularis]XP_034947374.1 uncharacterized protein DDB_G0284459-like [Chelonus insularis]
MGKTRGVHETTPELRNRMVGMYEAGLGLREIAAAVNCSQRTVKRWLNRFEKEGTVETRERCGRKRATTSEQDEAIVRLATQTQITAAKAVLPALGLTCSVDTVRERLHKAGIHNWSPSRKHIQKIPLGDADNVVIQQAVWRPTGTQLGKKKNQKMMEKSKKAVSSKKKFSIKKTKSHNRHNEDECIADPSKQLEPINSSFDYPASQNLPQPQHSSSQPPPIPLLQPPPPPQPPLPASSSSPPPASSSSSHITNSEIQSSQLIDNNQSDFNSGLNLIETSQPIYHHHSNIDLSQNWSLNLGQNLHHYSPNHQNPIIPEQSLQQHHLQELGAQQESSQVNHQDHLHGQQKQSSATFFDQHHQQQQHMNQVESSQLQQLDIQTNKESTKIVRSNSCSDSSSDNQFSDSNNELNRDESQSGKEKRRSGESSKRKTKKKGGKAKGTLETSVEIRNRMIGMSEAGLSTLSIALAINRSERTVKRWLERWNKEGNVLTKERKGRRRITTKEQDEAIVAMATQHPLTAAKHVAPALGLNCSVDTIRERLHKAGIHSWKLGKKHGEGNAVHTVHLWQPSGNRPNKIKFPNEKKKKTVSDKKSYESTSKRNEHKKKTDETPKPVSQLENILPEQNTMQYHNTRAPVNYPTSSNTMQPIHISTIQPLMSTTSVSDISSNSQSIQQPLGPIAIQQRPDCRMIAPISSQTNPIVNYSSCMITSNSHMDQPDSLNYEPFIWTF